MKLYNLLKLYLIVLVSLTSEILNNRGVANKALDNGEAEISIGVKAEKL